MILVHADRHHIIRVSFHGLDQLFHLCGLSKYYYCDPYGDRAVLNIQDKGIQKISPSHHRQTCLLSTALTMKKLNIQHSQHRILVKHLFYVLQQAQQCVNTEGRMITLSSLIVILLLVAYCSFIPMVQLGDSQSADCTYSTRVYQVTNYQEYW